MQSISSPPQANAETVINENFQTLQHQQVYGIRQPATTGLTWGYWGGRWGGFSVADGTLTLTNSATNYIVVAIATGVISVSTATTNWNNSDDYARVYRVTVAGGVPTNINGTDFDYRAGPGGIFGGAGGGGGGGGMTNPMTDEGDIIFGDVGGVPERLAIGDEGDVLTVGAGGIPEWAPGGGGGGMVNPMADEGDMIVGGAGGDPEALPVGSNGQVLTVVSGSPAWAAPAAPDLAAPIVTVATSSRTTTPADASKYLRFTATGSKTCSFDSGEGFSAPQEYHIANRSSSGNLTLTAGGSMVLNAPKGGTLVLEPGDTVTVKMVSSAAADVFGSTEAV